MSRTAIWGANASIGSKKSPQTYEKLPFYAGHGVEEVIVVEPASRTVRILAFVDGYQDVAISGALGLSADGLQTAIRWPSRGAPAG